MLGTTSLEVVILNYEQAQMELISFPRARLTSSCLDFDGNIIKETLIAILDIP